MALLKIPITLVLIMFFATLGSYEHYEPEEHLWKHRVILLFAPDSEHPEYQRVTAELAAAKSDVAERHLVVFEVLATDKKSAAARAEHAVATGDFTFVLIGKDGGEKFRTHTPKLEDVFAVIDSMPMRQQEQKRQPDT